MKPEETSAERPDGGGGYFPVCKDWLLRGCGREPCRFLHEPAPPSERRGLFQFCHDFQNKGCVRQNCRFVHCSVEDQTCFLRDGVFPPQPAPPAPLSMRPQMSVLPFNWPPPPSASPYYMPANSGGPPEAKLMRFSAEEGLNENCPNCVAAEHNVKRVHENYNVLLKKYNELKQKNVQLTSMNEFLLEQTAAREREGAIAITSRASAPVNLATVSVTPVVSLSELVPQAQPALTLDPATSRAQILTQAPQLLTHNSGALIVTSTGAHQLMQASTPATLVGGGQAVVAVAPAQLVASPSSATVQQLVQHSAQLAVAQQSAQQLVAQQSAQHLAVAQQSAQNLAAAAQQSVQQLAAAQQSAQQLAVAQQSQLSQTPQHLTRLSSQQGQQLVHPSSAQMTLSSAPQAMTQAPSHFPMISQSIMPH